MHAPVDPAAASRRQLHVFLLLDCSGSMQGDNIAALNAAVRAAIPAMQTMAGDGAVDVRVRAIRFADDATWHVATPTPLQDFAWADVAARGRTALGGALRLLARELAPSAMRGPQLRPIVILVSDGRPTDDCAGGLQALDAAPYGHKTIRAAIAIGGDADEATLRQFVGSSPSAPVRVRTAAEIVDCLRWVIAEAIALACRPSQRLAAPVSMAPRPVAV